MRLKDIKEELKRYDNMSSTEKTIFIGKMMRTLHPDYKGIDNFEHMKDTFDRQSDTGRSHYLQNMIVKYVDGSQWDTDDYKFFFGNHYHTYFDKNDKLIKDGLRTKKSTKPKQKRKLVKRCKCK